MPIYEYFCPNCEVKFELHRPINEMNKPASCPKCKGEGLRIFSTFISFSKESEEVFSSIISNPCAGCSATSCSTCRR